MKKVSVKMLLAAMLLAGCSTMDVDDMLEDGQAVSEEGSRCALSEEGGRVIIVFFWDCREMKIVATLKKEENEEQWDFQQMVLEDDKKEMGDVAHSLIQQLPSLDSYSIPCSSSMDTLRFYHGVICSVKSKRYKMIACSKQRIH